MANVFVDDESLKSIGNAIRTKLGVENTYLPSAMAEAVLSIPTGGGLDNYRVTQGTFTLESDHKMADDSEVFPFTITHNLGKIPRAFFFYQTDMRTSGSVVGGFMLRVICSSNASRADAHYSYFLRVNGSTNNTGATSVIFPVESNPTNAISICDVSYYSSYKNFILRAGVTYHWVAIVEDD